VPLLPLAAGAAPVPLIVNEPRVRNWLVLAIALLAAAIFAVVERAADDVAPSSLGAVSASARPGVTGAKRLAARGREAFVGSAVCVECHRAQGDAYLDSHHAKALVTPSAAVNARFAGQRFSSKLGGTTTFSLRDGIPSVTTPMPGEKVATFPVRYVAGVWPLEQYVVATERGKLQSLGVAWDTRTAASGDSQWFHVYGSEGVAPSDALFFTGPAQNWNHICADCHSTWLERRYDSASDSFDTRWAELSVGCEACHGPGVEHVRSARAGKPEPFAARLERSEPWRPSETGSPAPRAQDGREVQSCAPCHSRRTPLKEGFVASDDFWDSFEPDLLRPGRYHADGQVEGEVFEWASFLQSRMYGAGVECSDCHEPHSGKPLAQGNALCVRCHEPARFDVKEHSHHAGIGAPLCIDCHMPPATFMQIDERRDHSIRIPRPDHSVAFGVPNPCNGCHERQSASWASEWLERWAPAAQKRPHFVEALASDRGGQLDAPRRLRALAKDASFPAIARATALERLGSYSSESTLRSLRTALASSDALLVYGAVRGAALLPPQERARLLLPALEHRSLAVRVAAGKALAGVSMTQLPASSRSALERAFREVEQSFAVSASRPETHVEQSAFELARGRLREAERELELALRLDGCSVEAHLNLADLERRRGDESASERAIRAALACDPQSAAAHHALGLWQVRAKQAQAALASLRRAVELVPTDPRFSYVLAVALAGAGDRSAAIRVLEATLRHRANDASTLRALASYLHEAGQREPAADVGRRLQQLMAD
jgi:Tfp pilus assembly protein PilF